MVKKLPQMLTKFLVAPRDSESGLVYVDHVFMERFDQDSKIVSEKGRDDELALVTNTPFLLGSGIYCVDNKPASLVICGNLQCALETSDTLLQQLAWGREGLGYEMGKAISDVVLEDVLTSIVSTPISIDPNMQPSESFVAEMLTNVCGSSSSTGSGMQSSDLSVSVYLMEVKYKKAYNLISQWDPGIWRPRNPGIHKLNLNVTRHKYLSEHAFTKNVMKNKIKIMLWLGDKQHFVRVEM